MTMPPVPAPLAWLQALREPQRVSAWTLADWERVVRLARRLRLLGRLAEAVDAAGLLPAVPAPAALHLRAEQRYARWRTQGLVWALERIGQRLADAPYPRVLLKGAAYVGQGLAIGAGRLPSDVDILVPRAHIADAQARLAAGGWAEEPLDAHDQRYYREWSHEVPPMRHAAHGLELDLHHNILPPVARLTVDADALLARLQPSRWPGWQVLHPQDQVLHSAVHLFNDSEPRERVRDLVDLDALLRHFGREPVFWATLPARAHELGLAEPLALALHFAGAWLGTPVPEAARRAAQAAGPGPLRRAWLHPLLSALLWPTEPDAVPSRAQRLAVQAQLLRYHWGRMPLSLLLPHLWHKWRHADGGAVAPEATPPGPTGEAGPPR